MNLRFSKCTSLLLAALLLVVAQSQLASAQLNREVREKFQAMLTDLPTEIRSKFERALDNNSPVVELTPSQFRQFQRNPANPFDIDDIDPNELDGNIELRFELPSLRNRPVGRYERQSRSLRRNLREVIASAAKSTVEITDGDKQLALGTVVAADGFIVTKASEVAKAPKIYCKLRSRGMYPAEIVRINAENDLALLKVKVNDLTPIRWAQTQPLGGSFVIVPNPMAEAVALGSYSVVARSTIGENRGFLGVQPRAVASGVVIADVIARDTAAFEAGLAKGDVITSIDGHSVFEVSELVNEIGKHFAGDQIEIAFLRNGKANRTRAKLAARDMNGERAARFKMMSRLGAEPSERDTNFPVVFQHDAPLFPEQCGGPICDLQGNVLGLNISRESRAASYAIPANHLKIVLEDLLRLDVAVNTGKSR